MNKIDFEELYKQYLKDVYRYSFFKLRNKENAEDVASETFIRIMSFDIKSILNKKVWVISVARNVIYEKYRENIKYKTDDLNTTLLEESLEDMTNMESVIITEEMINLVKSQLASIDEDLKEILVLKIWEELKFNEIAQIVKENENTVKLRYYRGIEKLKEQLTRIKGKKNYSFTLPIIIGSISKIINSNEFIVNKSTSAIIGDKLSLSKSLIINEKNMNISKGLLNTVTGKALATLTLTAIVITGGVTGVSILNNNRLIPISYPNVVAHSTSIIDKPISTPSENNPTISSSISSQANTITISSSSEYKAIIPLGWSQITSKACNVKVLQPPKQDPFIVTTLDEQVKPLDQHSTIYQKMFKSDFFLEYRQGQPSKTSAYSINDSDIQIFCGNNTNNLSLDDLSQKFQNDLINSAFQNKIISSEKFQKWGLNITKVVYSYLSNNNLESNPTQTTYLLASSKYIFQIDVLEDVNNASVSNTMNQITDNLTFFNL